MMTIIPADVRAVGGREVLAGRLAGEAARPSYEEAIGEASYAVVVLDFRDVELVTASYFLAAFEWLFMSAEARTRNLYPLLANLNKESRDEVVLALKARGLRALIGRFDAEGLSEVVPENLDPEASATYRQVEALGEVVAADLFRNDPKIQPTGWSNRLALLYEYRLLRRRKQGRQLFYALSWR